MYALLNHWLQMYGTSKRQTLPCLAKFALWILSEVFYQRFQRFPITNKVRVINCTIYPFCDPLFFAASIEPVVGSDEGLDFVDAAEDDSAVAITADSFTNSTYNRKASRRSAFRAEDVLRSIMRNDFTWFSRLRRPSNRLSSLAFHSMV